MIFFSFFTDASNGGYQGHSSSGNSNNNELVPDNPLNTLVPSRWSEPYFDATLPRNVTALSGKSAYLSCRVINLGNKTVSTKWFFDVCLGILLLFGGRVVD